jgi:hypothetical protein
MLKLRGHLPKIRIRGFYARQTKRNLYRFEWNNADILFQIIYCELRNDWMIFLFSILQIVRNYSSLGNRVFSYLWKDSVKHYDLLSILL